MAAMNTFSEQAWEAAGQVAVSQRDASLDGHLWYGVVTTGIYCRPSCPSPPAKPENLRFFRNTKDAESQGFRACKRCLPQSLTGLPSYLPDALDRLSANSVAQVAEQVGVSAAHLTRVFEQWLGFSPKQFQLFARADAFQRLREQGVAVLDAALQAGFSSDGPVYKSAKPMLVHSPRTLERFSQPLTFSIAPCSLGWLLAAWSDKGLVFSGLNNTPGGALEDCLSRFPNAEFIACNAHGGAWVEQLVAFLDAQGPWPDLPIDVAGSAFRLRIWQALRDLPAGQRVTYRTLADSAGQPKAARAVGSACASNPVCLAVPCHRVVPASGGSGQYFWQPWRKAWLLEMEKHL